MLMNQFQQVLGQPMPADPSQLPPEQQNQLALMAANAIKQHLLTTPGIAPKPPVDPKDQLQLQKLNQDHEVSFKDLEIKEKRIEADLEIAHIEARTSEQKSAQESNDTAIKYTFEQHKLDYERQINEKSKDLQMKIDQEKHERENLESIVNLLREAFEQNNINNGSFKKGEV